jgi:hypothetical protein
MFGLMKISSARRAPPVRPITLGHVIRYPRGLLHVVIRHLSAFRCGFSENWYCCKNRIGTPKLNIYIVYMRSNLWRLTIRKNQTREWLNRGGYPLTSPDYISQQFRIVGVIVLVLRFDKCDYRARA